MSNKLKSKNRKNASVKSVKEPKKLKSLVQSNTKLTVLVLIVAYFLLDYLMMDGAKDLNRVLTVIFTMMASSTLYSFYVYDYQRGIYPTGGTDVPKFVKNKTKFVTIGWFMITIWGILLLIIEPFVVPRFFPVVDNTYYQPQILLMLYVAPVIEEIIFRYLLYDRWLRRKLGWLPGFLVASLIFVVTHPVTNLHSLIIYWVPTLLFFLIYHEFGLYGSIVMHMVYNMMAI